MYSRELCQVSAGHLTMTNDSLGGHIGVRDIIGPEFMPRIGADAVDDVPGRAGRPAFTDEQPHQAALGDRAGREVAAQADKPVLSGSMVNMIVDEQGDEQVRVEKDSIRAGSQLRTQPVKAGVVTAALRGRIGMLPSPRRMSRSPMDTRRHDDPVRRGRSFAAAARRGVS